MIRDGEGLRAGSDWLIRVTFRSANRARDLSAYTVTGQGKLNAGSAFAVTLTPVTDGSDGQYDVAGDAADLTAEGTLYVEFTFVGSPTVNAPAKPLEIPVREEFGEAP